MHDDASRDERARFDDEVAGYRQPMVTSLGIILGFLLAFLANWAVDTGDVPAPWSASDWLILATLGISIVLFAVVLFRMLDNEVQPKPGLRYRNTLHLYMAAIVIAFTGVAGALLL